MADSIPDASATEICTVIDSRSVDDSGLLSNMAEGSLGSTQSQILAVLTTMNETLVALYNQSVAGQTTINESLLALKQAVEGGAESSNRKDSKPGCEAVTIDPEVLEEFASCISWGKCERLVEMLDEQPVELMLQVRDCNDWTVLHVAVMERSKELLDKVNNHVNLLKDGGRFAASEEFFAAIDNVYKLTAVDLGVLVGDFWGYTADAICDFDFSSTGPYTPGFREETELREVIKRILTEPVSRDDSSDTWKDVLDSYYDGCTSINREEFCLYAAFYLHDIDVAQGTQFIQTLCEKFGDIPLLQELLCVRDVQGMTILHYLVDRITEFDISPFLELLSSHIPGFDPNIPDAKGRTPLHSAAAQGYTKIVNTLLAFENTNLSASLDYTNLECGAPQCLTALHLAAIHNHFEVVDALLKDPRCNVDDVNKTCERPLHKYGYASALQDLIERNQHWTTFQLAAWMGHSRIVQLLLEDKRLFDRGLKILKRKIPEHYNNIPALHLAAACSQSLVIKILLEKGLVDIFVRDKNGNTALHYAAIMAGEEIVSSSCLFDYASWKHHRKSLPNKSKRNDYDIITSMNLLMENGLDMQQTNNSGETPTLSPSSSEIVQKWWLDKMSIMMQEEKSNLNTAANAIGVTAALVATASFVGPLQPPLGLSTNDTLSWLNGYSQVNIPVVKGFYVCDCFSFYFAIASIVCAMLPSCPIPHEGLFQEVRIARRCVQVAVLFLFASITFVIGAFAAASISIMPTEIWYYQVLAILTSCFGIFICFSILFLAFLRLLRLIASKSEHAKKISDSANAIFLWSGTSKDIENILIKAFFRSHIKEME